MTLPLYEARPSWMLFLKLYIEVFTLAGRSGPVPWAQWYVLTPRGPSAALQLFPLWFPVLNTQTALVAAALSWEVAQLCSRPSSSWEPGNCRQEAVAVLGIASPMHISQEVLAFVPVQWLENITSCILSFFLVTHRKVWISSLIPCPGWKPWCL